MPKSYTLENKGSIEEEVISRVTQLNVNGKKYDSLLTSFDKRLTMKAEGSAPSKPINEIYMKMDLAKLIELDSNDDKHEDFIRSHGKNLKGESINLFLVNLFLNGSQKLEEKDYDYVNELLLMSKNDIFQMPVVTFQDVESKECYDKYVEFVKGVLSAKNNLRSDLKVGLTIPAYVQSRKIEDLLKIFRDENKEPDLLLLDFHNSLVNREKMERKLLRTHAIYKKKEREREGDAYFLYGMRVRERERGILPSPARDTEAVITGLNALGRTHADASVDFRKIPLPKWTTSAAYNSKKVIYESVVSDRNLADEFKAFSIKHYGRVPNYDIDPDPKGPFMDMLKQFSRSKQNNRSDEIATLVKDGDESSFKSSLKDLDVYKSATNFAKKARKGGAN